VVATQEEVLWNCRSALAAAVGAGSPDDRVVQALAALVLGHPSPMELEEVIAAGIAAGYPSGALLKTLLRCQLFDLEALLADAQERTPLEALDALRTLFLQHQQIHNAFIERFGEHAAEGADDGSALRARAEHDAQLLHALQAQWRASGQVEFFNYFRELQVPATAPFVDLDEYYLTVGRTPRLSTVLAAGERGCIVYAPTDDPGRLVRFERYAASADALVLRIAGLRDHPQGLRQRLRVEVPGEAVFRLQLPDGEAPMAYLRDFSVSGMRLDVSGVARLRPGIQVQCSGSLGTRLRKIELTMTVLVRWTTAVGDVTRIGVELVQQQGHRELLDRLVREYEQEAIKALNMIAQD